MALVLHECEADSLSGKQSAHRMRQARRTGPLFPIAIVHQHKRIKGYRFKIDEEGNLSNDSAR
jgi:hypothetical protein